MIQKIRYNNARHGVWCVLRITVTIQINPNVPTSSTVVGSAFLCVFLCGNFAIRELRSATELS